MPVSAFRRSVKAETKKTGKGFKGGFFEKWRFHKDIASPILVLNGNFLDPSPDQDSVQIDPTTRRPVEVHNAFFKYPKHTRKMSKNGKDFFADEICSAGIDPHNPRPCVGCHHMDTGDKTLKLSDVFTFTIVHLHPYHGHPVLDDSGKIRMRSDGKGHIINFTECAGQRQCNYCRTLNGQPLMQTDGEQWPGWTADQLTTVFGQRRYIELGKNHLADIGAWDSTVGAVCGVDGSPFVTDSFQCPWCRSVLIDMAQDPRTDEQIAEAVSKLYPCMHCNQPVLPVEVSSCDICRANGRQHIQNSIFDVVLWGMRSGEGTNSHLVLQRSETIEQFANSVHPGYLGGKTFREYIKELAKPHEFDKMFEPKSLADQAKRLELSIPAFNGAQAGSYGQQNQQPPNPGVQGPPAGAQGYGQAAPPPGAQQGQQQPPPGQAPAPGTPAPGAPAFIPPGRQNFN